MSVQVLSFVRTSILRHNKHIVEPSGSHEKRKVMFPFILESLMFVLNFSFFLSDIYRPWHLMYVTNCNCAKVNTNGQIWQKYVQLKIRKMHDFIDNNSVSMWWYVSTSVTNGQRAMTVPGQEFYLKLKCLIPWREKDFLNCSFRGPHKSNRPAA